MLYGVKRALLFGDKIKWLLRDDFNDTLAAGAVDGTPATPGPGTRTVVDTDGDGLSMAGGRLIFANPNAVYGDPGLWLDAITRVPGRTVVAEIMMTNTNKNQRVGWDDAQAGTPETATGHFDAVAAIKLIYQAGPIPVVAGAYQSNKPYNIAIPLRTSGSYLLIKGGIYLHWTLMWDSLLTNTATIYPVTTTHDGTHTSSFIRVPEQTWLPTPLAYDTFTRADGAIGSTEATGPDGQGVPSKTWIGATWAIDTNQAKNTPALGAEEAAGNLTVDNWYQITATQVNHFFAGCAIGDCFRAAGATALDANNKVQQITLVDMFSTFATGTPSVLISGAVTLDAGVQVAGYITNLDDAAAPDNFLIAYHDGTNAHLEKCAAGTYTSLINAAAAYAAGRVPRIHTYRSGANLKARLYYNNVLIGAEQTIADAGIVDNVIHGMASTNPVNRLDTFQLLARGEEGQYDGFLDKVVK